MLLLCTCVLGILSYEQICSAARDYSLCVTLHSSGMRPAVICLLLNIGIPNENHDDTEQISSDTINLVDRHRVRTDDVVRATWIRRVRASAVCVSSLIQSTLASISPASTTAILLLYVLHECVPVVYHRTSMYWVTSYRWIVPKKSCRLRRKKTLRLTIENEWMSTLPGKKKAALRYEYRVRLVYLPAIE